MVKFRSNRVKKRAKIESGEWVGGWGSSRPEGLCGKLQVQDLDDLLGKTPLLFTTNF